MDGVLRRHFRNTVITTALCLAVSVEFYLLLILKYHHWWPAEESHIYRYTPLNYRAPKELIFRNQSELIMLAEFSQQQPSCGIGENPQSFSPVLDNYLTGLHCLHCQIVVICQQIYKLYFFGFVYIQK